MYIIYTYIFIPICGVGQHNQPNYGSYRRTSNSPILKTAETILEQKDDAKSQNALRQFILGYFHNWRQKDMQNYTFIYFPV